MEMVTEQEVTGSIPTVGRFCSFRTLPKTAGE